MTKNEKKNHFFFHKNLFPCLPGIPSLVSFSQFIDNIFLITQTSFCFVQVKSLLTLRPEDATPVSRVSIRRIPRYPPPPILPFPHFMMVTQTVPSITICGRPSAQASMSLCCLISLWQKNTNVDSNSHMCSSHTCNWCCIA